MQIRIDGNPGYKRALDAKVIHKGLRVKVPKNFFEQQPRCDDREGKSDGVKKVRDFLSQHKYFYLLLLFIPLQIWFEFLELTIVPQYITDTAIDYKIPFIKEFVVPYLLWFIYVPFGLLYTGIHSRKDFIKLFLFLFGGMLAAYTIFTFFPNAQSLRPTIIQNDPFSILVKFIYIADTPTNVCPSVHVINSIAVNAALQHSDAFSKDRLRKWISLILSLLICLSTVFIKQHSVLDVISGTCIGALFYFLLYILPDIKQSLHHMEEEE